MTETSLEKAEKRYAQAKARLQALKNREADKQRKLDTRRKVILGGALMDLAERDDGARAMLDRLVRNLVRDQDRAVFAGWTPPRLGGDGAAVANGADGGGAEVMPSEGGAASHDPAPASDASPALEDPTQRPGRRGLELRHPDPYSSGA